MLLVIDLFFCSHFDQGRDLFGCAPTGSGKTAAFIIPMLLRLKVCKSRCHLSFFSYPANKTRSVSCCCCCCYCKQTATGKLRGVVVSPTRELAQQLHHIAQRLAEGTGFHVLLLTGKNRSVVKNPAAACGTLCLSVCLIELVCCVACANVKANVFYRGVDILVTTPMLLVKMIEGKELPLETCVAYLCQQFQRVICFVIFVSLRFVFNLSLVLICLLRAVCVFVLRCRSVEMLVLMRPTNCSKWGF